MQLQEITVLIDEYYLQREKRLELDRASEELQKRERELKAQIISYMEEERAGVLGGFLATVRLKITPKPTSKDWWEVWAWAKANDAPDIYQRRLNEAAVTERREQGVLIPGIEWFPVATLSVSKGAKRE